jgi:predicted esterase
MASRLQPVAMIYRRTHAYRLKPGRHATWGVHGFLFVAIGLFLTLAATAHAAKLTLNDGRVLEGNVARLSKMAENPKATQPKEGVETRPIVLIDDHVRRIFVPFRQLQQVDEKSDLEQEEKFVFADQPVARTGETMMTVGNFIGVTPWDEYGRRTVQMMGARGAFAVIQGITELRPHWVKVEGLSRAGHNYIWDMRVATTTIPFEMLDKILAKRTDPKNIAQRLKVVRFYLQMERYKEAEEKLKSLIADFPNEKNQYGPTALRLRQAYARRILEEVKVRRESGQHALALSMLQNFPTEDVAGETLRAVRETIDGYKADYDRGSELLKQLDAHIAELKGQVAPNIVKAARDEINQELNLSTLNRMAAYTQFAADPTMQPDEKVALAISGWLVGAADATRRLPVAISLFETRNLVRRYMTESLKLTREEILASLRSQEGATPAYVAKLVSHMLPPLAPGEPLEGSPGLYQLEVEVLPGQPTIPYLVQLPPEYDPHRTYPAIITLHSAGSSPELQIDWWAGARLPESGLRQGHAARHGTIVIAPAWAKNQQRSYAYSVEEFAAVLNSLRDACRRFAIDPDRVFLSGHSMGGDAAWDIGLAHPDLFAGVIPITAVADKYVTIYWQNAKNLPVYLVTGELDGDKSSKNAAHLDRYMQHGYNVTVTQFQGRGHEHFADEILRLFDWMGRHRREPFPREIEVSTMRPWDNYFWWLGMANLPPKAMVDPDDWPPPINTRASPVKAQINAKNGVTVTTGAGETTIWFAPEMIDFNQPIRVSVNGKSLGAGSPPIQPDLTTLLEDVRIRADRQHPFWAKIEMPSGRVNGGNK